MSDPDVNRGERIDMSGQITEICGLFGVAPEYVKQIVLNPGDAELTVYKTRNGGKYVDDDGQPATVTFLFDIQT